MSERARENTDHVTLPLVERLRAWAEDDLRELARDVPVMGLRIEASELRLWADLMDEAADEIDRLSAVNVPDWKLVPVEPTLGMAHAYDTAYHNVCDGAAFNVDGFEWFAAGYRAMLSAAPLPPNVTGSQWKDISSAPKDGTNIMLCATGFEPTKGRWIEYSRLSLADSHWLPSKRDGQWVGLDPDGVFDDDDALMEFCAGSSYTPTHWMPLPPGPDDRTNSNSECDDNLKQSESIRSLKTERD